MKRLFSERQGRTAPRVSEELSIESARGLLALVTARIDENWFGKSFPYSCPDGTLNAGGDAQKLRRALDGFNLIWPPSWLSFTEKDGLLDASVFDVLEFSYEHLALPQSFESHSYHRHHHFRYDIEAGRSILQDDVNRIFERQGLAFELRNGQVIRLASTGLQEALTEALFKTGDDELDRLLEIARAKFFDRSANTRKEGLEKLWDAWERLKTLESGQTKREQATALLDKASTELVFRRHLEVEARELTGIGNNLMIRHTEVGKPAIASSVQVDYLYHRMFALIRLLLKSTDRGG